MKSYIFIIFSLLMVASCEKDTIDYIPESRPYLDEILNRVSTLPANELREFDALNADYLQKIQILSCVHCQLDEEYFGPLRAKVDGDNRLLDRLLELGIRNPAEARLLGFKYFIMHNYPDIYHDILRHLDLDEKLIPADEVKTDSDRWHNQNVNYSGDIEVWIKFYLEGT